MTKAQIIDEIIAKKQELLSVATKKAQEIKNSRKESFYSVIQKYFDGELGIGFSDGDPYILKPKYEGKDSWEILRPHSEYSYDKEVGTIRIDRPYSWEKTEEADAPSMRISSYSTSTGGTWELERHIILGRVAMVIQDFQDDIIAELDTVTESYKKKYDSSESEVREIERDIRQLKDEKNNTLLRIAEKLIESKDGLKFGGDKKGSLDLRWDWTLRGVSSAKIINKTASGKSADIKISTYGETPRVYEKVRMSNIENLFWQYRDYVLTAKAK